jgi:uncharacterized repeat protein (TIGR01451 family)
VRTHLSRRVLAGATSLAIGGVFVAASAMAALADSPSPTTMNASVATSANGTVTVTLDGGGLAWNNGGHCSANKGAGYAIIWGDPAAPGNALPGTTGVGTTVSTFGQPADNAVHATACTGTSTTFGPISHTYASRAALPAQVCAVGYHYDNKTASGSHSMIAGGVGLNTDNSVQEPNQAPLQSVFCVNLVVKQPDPTVTKTGPTQVTLGQDITWTIDVSNIVGAAVGTDQNVTLTDSLPSNVQYKSFSAAAPWSCTGGQNFSCSLSSQLAPSQHAPAITLTATTLSVGTVHNTAVVGTPDDANTTNNTSSWDTVVNPGQTPPSPDVTIQKDATPSVVVGGNITYTITVSNDSKQDTDKTLTVTDNVPVTVQVTSVVPGNGWSCTGTQNISCTYSKSLAGGATAPVIKVIGTALAGAAPSVTNIADVTNPNDTNPNNNEDKATTVVDTTAPVLSLVKSSDPASGSTVKRGQQIDYTLTYSNTGDGDAGLTVITDGIPANTTYVPGSAACGAAGCNASYDVGDNDVDWSLNLPAHATGSVTFSVTVNNDAPDNTVIDNVATINNNGHKIPSNHVRHLVFVPSGDIALVKSVDPKTAKAGTVLNYTLVATASGNITQHNVVVTDEVPDGTTYTSADCASPCTASFDSSTGIATWQLGDMSPGDSQSLAFTVTVNGPVNGTLPASIPNVGHVKSNETPKTPSNRVVVPVTQVLGTKITRTVPPATTLPFTGIPVLQDILLAMVLVGAGVTLLTWPRIQPQRRTV